jgi:hypothetical protein
MSLLVMSKQPPQSKLSLWVYVSMMALFSLYAIAPESSDSRDANFNLQEVSITHTYLNQSLSWLVFLTAIGLFSVCAFSISGIKLRWPIIGILIALIFYPCCWMYHVLSNLGPWTKHGTVTLEDVTQYAFLDSSFLQGQTMAIARLEASGFFSERFKVLVDTNGDWPRSWQSLVRPEGSTDEYGQLYLAPGQILVGVRYENKCYLAYDLQANQSIGFEAIENISPFVCLDKDSTLNETDVIRLTTTMRDDLQEHMQAPNQLLAPFLSGTLRAGGANMSGYPTIESLEQALQHDNPQVREVAKKLFDIHQAAVEKSLPKFRENAAQNILQLKAPGVEERRAAIQNLSSLGEFMGKEGVEALTEFVRNNTDYSEQRSACEALGEAGKMGFAPLLKLAQHGSSSIRLNAIAGLRRAGMAAKTEEILLFLNDAQHDKDREFRQQAAHFLKELEQGFLDY